jgi:hypothetical protein
MRRPSGREAGDLMLTGEDSEAGEVSARIVEKLGS